MENKAIIDAKRYELLSDEYEDLDTVLARVIPDTIDAWLDSFPEGLHTQPMNWQDCDELGHSWEDQLRSIANKIRRYDRDYPGWDDVDIYESAKAALSFEQASKAQAVEALMWLVAHFRELWD